MQKTTVCILGGSGFVGQHIACQLADAGYLIKILTRRASHCQKLSVLPNTQIIETDVHQQDQLDQQFAQVDVVINLVGILNERQHNGDGFRQVHVELTRKVINACHHNQVKRLLHMSALNADASMGSSHYLRTKGEAENMAHSFAGDIKVTSFRPSVIFGPGDSFFNRFAALLKLSPKIFPLACAGARFAPVYVQDVARCFVQSINNSDTYDQRLELCGPEVYTLKELVSFTSQQIGARHWIIPLPKPLGLVQALLLEYFPGKPFSLDNYDSLKTDSVCTQPTAYCSCQSSALGIVPGYLGRQTRHTKDDQDRQLSRRS